MMRVQLFTSILQQSQGKLFYCLVDFGGKEAEFCTDGNIKLAVYAYETKLNKHANMPSLEDLELFYIRDTQIYIPIFYNARLLC